MTRLPFLGLLAGLLVIVASPALARADDAAKTQPYVIVVGVSKYTDPQILPRKNAEADAKALYDLYVNKDHLGVDAKHIKLLLGSPDEKRKSEPATKENIVAALNWAAKNAKRDDLVIFAFFGQGAPLGERNVYLASDSTFKDRANNGVAAADIEGILEKLKSQRVVAFLDLSFKGFDLGKEAPPDVNLANLFKEFLGKQDEKGPTDSRSVFLPNNGLKPAVELKDNGAFATAIIEGLQGKADTDGYEADGLITVGELAKYLKKELPALYRKHGKNDEEKSQLPVILEGQTSDFVLDYNPPAKSQSEKLLAAFKKLADDGKIDKERVKEGETLLARMPKLDAQQAMRKAYQKLAEGKLTADAFEKARVDIVAGTKISDREANEYARFVIRATEIVKESYVKAVNQGQLIEWGLRGLYKKLEEPIPATIEDKLKEAKNLRQADLLKLLVESRVGLGKREDLAKGNDVTETLHPMLGKLDRHTDYTDPETLIRDMVNVTGNFSGIGVQIRKNNIKDLLQVVTPIKGSPAYQAKMYAGDLITTIIREVDSKGNKLDQPEVISTKGMTTEDAVKKILGKEGTPVKLIVEREGQEKPLEFNLVRGRVEVETVLGHKRTDDDSWNYVIDPENKICYVRLTQFTRKTHQDLDVVMRKLSKAGIKGFVLDLRFNPGGLLDSAVKISDMFIDDGMIVTIRPRNGPETSYVGKHDGSYLTFPMVCLVNGYSASGSEIVAGCLQDHGRAVVMGSRSYGKGSVQTILPFDTGGQLKLTTATFWRPNGKNLNKASTSGKDEDEWGVTPNKGYIVNLPTKELYDLQEHQRDTEIIRPPGYTPKEAKAEFRDRQLNMALEYLRAQIKTANKAEVNKKAG